MATSIYSFLKFDFNGKKLFNHLLIWTIFLVLTGLSLDFTLDLYRRADFTSDIRLREASFWSGRKEFKVLSSSQALPGQIPGPLDTWGGSEGKVVHLTIPFCGPYTISVNLLDSHKTSPPTLRFFYNNNLIQTAKTPKGVGEHAQHWRRLGVRSVLKMRVNDSNCANGRSSFSMQTIQGSWAAIDGIHFRPVVSSWKLIFLSIAWFVFAAICLPFIHHSTRRKSSEALVLIGSVVLTAFYLFFYADTVDFSDTAYFGGDTWEYQSMGVNLALGYGVNVIAGYRPFEYYKFDNGAERRYPKLKKAFMAKGTGDNSLNALRTPGYPTFLGVVYAVFGVSPRIAKQVQFILMVVIAGFLPLIGYQLASWQGFTGGLVGGYSFLNNWGHALALHLLTESLTAFAIFITLLAFLTLRRQANFYTATLFGVFLGLNPIVKGSLVLALPLFFIYIALSKNALDDSSDEEPHQNTLRQLNSRVVKRRNILLAIIFGSSLAIVPWGAYASVNSGKLIIFSTQAESLLLQSNFSGDGDWRPEATARNTNSFYNKEEIKKLPVLIQIIAFYYEHPGTIAPAFRNKLNNAFNGYVYFKILTLIAIVEILISLIRSSITNTRFQRIYPHIYAATILSAGIAVLLASYFSLWGKVNSDLLIITLCIFAFISITTLRRIKISIPGPLLIYLINIMAITLIFYGSRRFAMPFSFIFAPIAAGYIAHMIAVVYISMVKSESTDLKICKGKTG